MARKCPWRMARTKRIRGIVRTRQLGEMENAFSSFPSPVFLRHHGRQRTASPDSVYKDTGCSPFCASAGRITPRACTT